MAAARSKAFPSLLLALFVVLAGCSSAPPMYPKAREEDMKTLETNATRYPSRFYFEIGGKTGLIDREGHVVVPPHLEGVSDDFLDGLESFREHDLEGYIDVNGQVVIPPRFAMAGEFSEGLAAAALPTVLDAKGRWLIGFIDRSGEFVIPPQFQYASAFKEGLARVGSVDDNVRRFINQKGEIALELPQYDNVGSFAHGLAYVRAGNKYGAINQQGEEVIALQFDRVKGDFSEGLLLVEQHDVWFFIDTQGQQAFPETFENAERFSEGRAPVEFGGKWGYIDRTGALVIEPIYDDPRWFVGGVACPGLLKEKKPKDKVETYWYGVIDPDGNMVLPFEYDSISWFRDGLARARKGETYGYIDLSGRLIFVIPSAAQ